MLPKETRKRRQDRKAKEARKPLPGTFEFNYKSQLDELLARRYLAQSRARKAVATSQMPTMYNVLALAEDASRLAHKAKRVRSRRKKSTLHAKNSVLQSQRATYNEPGDHLHQEKAKAKKRENAKFWESRAAASRSDLRDNDFDPVPFRWSLPTTEQRSTSACSVSEAMLRVFTDPPHGSSASSLLVGTTPILDCSS